MRKTTHRTFLRVFRPLGVFACLATALPTLHSRSWWVRALDFPRLQIAAIGGLGLACGIARRDQFTGADRWLAGLTGAAIFAQLTRFAKYTPLTPKQVVRRPADPEWLVSILTANVRMRNQSADRLLSLVKQREPDLVLLMETDERWARQVESLHASYPHRVVRPLDNTYGIILYSRLPLVEPRVRFLVQEDIPSIQTRIRLRNGREFWFYGVHPRPPARGNVDGEIELPGSAPRDAELVIVAMEIRDLHQPVIVAGDFNDVAWSHTTRRFQRLSRTLDPRVGRGLYSTFHAGNRLLRFPLDHLFISEHFAVNEFCREGNIGSDHFPLYARLVMDPSLPALQEPPESQEEDFDEAQDTLVAAAEQEAEDK